MFQSFSGRAAVRSSDYAFAKFKHLQRVLLVHGHWYYYRTGNLVQYFFYKNIACFSAQLYFQFFNSFSTETLFEEVCLTLYNIIYTSIPIFLFGLFEKNFDDVTLLANPSLYKTIRKNALISPMVSMWWLFDAIWSSLVTFFTFYFLFIKNSNETSQDSLGLLSFGFSIYQCVVIVVSFRLLANSRYWNILLLLIIFISLFLLLCVNLIDHSLPTRPFDEVNRVYQVIFHVLSSPTVWLATLLCTSLCLLPYIIEEYVRNVVRLSLFSKESLDLTTTVTENANIELTQDDCEIIDNRNWTDGISIIGSGSKPSLKLPHKARHNPNKDDAKNHLSNSYMNTHNPEYAFINNGYVGEDAKEETYL